MEKQADKSRKALMEELEGMFTEKISDRSIFHQFQTDELLCIIKAAKILSAGKVKMMVVIKFNQEGDP